MAEFLFRINGFGPSTIVIRYSIKRGGWQGMTAPKYEGDPADIEKFKGWAVPAAVEAKIFPGRRRLYETILGIPCVVYEILRYHKRDFEVTGDLPEGYDAPKVVKNFLFRINDCELAPVMVHFETGGWHSIGEPTYIGSPLDVAMIKEWITTAPIEYWHRVNCNATTPSSLFFFLRRHKRDFEVTGDLPEGYDGEPDRQVWPTHDEDGNEIVY